VSHLRHEATRDAQGELLGRGFGNIRNRAFEAQQKEQLTRVAHGIAPQLLPARWCGRGLRVGGVVSEGGGSGYHVGSRFSGAADFAQRSPPF
jgi:hypothetical protein